MKRTTDLTTQKTGFNVLVIDENELNREETRLALERAWPFDRTLRVAWAAGALDALAHLRAARYTLVLLHLRHPDDDGATTLRLLREQGVRLPAVVMSALHCPEWMTQLKAFAAAAVPKPHFDKLTFYDAIHNSLRLLGLLPESAPTRVMLTR